MRVKTAFHSSPFEPRGTQEDVFSSSSLPLQEFLLLPFPSPLPRLGNKTFTFQPVHAPSPSSCPEQSSQTSRAGADREGEEEGEASPKGEKIAWAMKTHKAVLYMTEIQASAFWGSLR